LFISLFLTSLTVSAIDIDISLKEWKKLGMPNRFPTTIYITKNLSPIYYETGINVEELGEFLVALKKNQFDDDVDEDDKLVISQMLKSVLGRISEGKVNKEKDYLINVTPSKSFDCSPCDDQQNFIEILNLSKINLITIYLI